MSGDCKVIPLFKNVKVVDAAAKKDWHEIDEQEERERSIRIRASLERINKLMEVLKRSQGNEQ